MKIRVLFLAAMLCALCVGQASALEYTMEAPDDYLFARPTSDETIYEWENPNVDRSKNTALIPPTFGSPTSYLPGSGTPLTPNLVPVSYTHLDVYKRQRYAWSPPHSSRTISAPARERTVSSCSS